MGNTTERTMVASAFTLGVVAGLRSQMPLALLGWRSREESSKESTETLPAALRNPWFAPIAALLATGELIGDKLPITPSRLNPGPLAGRLLFGGLAGATTANATRQRLATGALAGASGALVGSFGGYHTRKVLGQLSGIPDPIVAIGEDAFAIGAGIWAVHRLPFGYSVQKPACDS